MKEEHIALKKERKQELTRSILQSRNAEKQRITITHRFGNFSKPNELTAAASSSSSRGGETASLKASRKLIDSGDESDTSDCRSAPPVRASRTALWRRHKHSDRQGSLERQIRTLSLGAPPFHPGALGLELLGSKGVRRGEESGRR